MFEWVDYAWEIALGLFVLLIAIIAYLYWRLGRK